MTQRLLHLLAVLVVAFALTAPGASALRQWSPRPLAECDGSGTCPH